MPGENILTLAVAGSRKTQGIVDACAASPAHERILILTYTRVNQDELRARLASQAGDRANIEVMGWFTFLIAHFVRPFVPFVFPGQRIHGFDFESDPQQYAGVATYSRYFNRSGHGRRVHLSQLATRICDASGESPISRLVRLYDRIYIDEVQDLCGYDLDVLTRLLRSACPVWMVGDVRQAVLSTNPREQKNKKFMYMAVWKWFQAAQKAGLLRIEQRATTWRCRREIAEFADSLFSHTWGFEQTVSLNDVATDHDGLFFVREEHVDAYLQEFEPLFLRATANSARDKLWDFMNFKVSKGLTRERVLIWPTEAITKFVTRSIALSETQAADLYVAATRAEQSVTFVVDDPQQSLIRYWVPAASA